MKKAGIILWVFIAVPLIAWAADRPAPQQTREVVDYYFDGKGNGAVLMDRRVCSEIASDGEDKNDCRQPADLATIAVGDALFLWMNFMVPAGDQAAILVNFSHNQRVRKTANATLKGAIRYRTWKPIPTDRAGKWTVTIVQELADRDLELATFDYTVNEGAP